MKLACVIHRFGGDVAGGSEAHCRAIAGRLAGRHDVGILTTTARDHVTWAEAFPAGASTDGPLRVQRFPVARPRSLHRFFEASEVAFRGAASEADEIQWFRENGPETPALLKYLEVHGAEYDRILFWSYRYYQSFFGLPLVAPRAVLVPTAEEDPAIALDVLDRYFSLPSGYLFLTPEERDLVSRRCSQPLAPSCIIGTGIEPPVAAAGSMDALGGLVSAGLKAGEDTREARGYVLYLGRIDPNKGCETLFRHFLRLHDVLPPDVPRVPLVLAGPANMPVPDHPMIRSLGYVTDAVREALLAHATVLVVPSPYESLSIALLEAWNHGVPALVNGRCSVLKGQARRSGGALYYRDFDEFAHGLRYLLTHDVDRHQLGRQGRAYIDREYRWPHVMETLEGFLASLPPVTEASRR